MALVDVSHSSTLIGCLCIPRWLTVPPVRAQAFDLDGGGCFYPPTCSHVSVVGGCFYPPGCFFNLNLIQNDVHFFDCR